MKRKIKPLKSYLMIPMIFGRNKLYNRHTGRWEAIPPDTDSDGERFFNSESWQWEPVPPMFRVEGVEVRRFR